MDPGVVAWIGKQHQEDCFLIVVIIGQIELGIARIARAMPDLRSSWPDGWIGG